MDSWAILNPRPARLPRPPLWFGALGPYVLKKVTARLGDAWVPPVPGITREEYERIQSAIRSGETKGRTVKMMFNGTLPELQFMIEEYTKKGYGGAMLVRTSYDELPAAMRGLQAAMRSYKR